MKRLLVLATIISWSAFGVYKVGDKVDNLCWKDNNDKQVCLDDFPGDVKVLLYNAGWCGPCNEEFSELAPKTDEFDGKTVTFISLSCSGWDHGSDPTKTFLNEWKDKHGIKFIVAGSPKDCGRKFISGTVYIPNVAIVNANRILTYAEINPGVEAIFSEVKSLINK